VRVRFGTGSPGQQYFAESGQVTGQCVSPLVWPGFFNFSVISGRCLGNVLQSGIHTRQLSYNCE